MALTQSIRWRYLVQEATLFLVLSELLLFGSSHNGLVQPWALAVTSGIFGSISLMLLIFGWKMPRLPVDFPALTFLGIILLSSLASIDPRRSLTETWLLGIMVFLFLAVIRLVQLGWPAELFIKVILIIGTIFMGLAWVEVFGWYQTWFNTNGWKFSGLTFRLSIPNFYAVLLNVLLMMALARLSTSRDRAPRFLLSLLSLSALILLFFTSSRGGWLGTIAGLGTLAALALYHEKNRVRASLKWFSQRRMLSAILVASFLLLLIIVGFLAYQQTLHPTHSPVEGARGYLWKPAWHAFLRSPFIGEGVYTFISHYLRENSIPPGMPFVYAHSIYLDLLSGSGLLGFAGFSWLVWRMVSLLRARFLNPGEFPDLAVGGLAVLAAVGVHGIIDSVHHTIPTSGWLIAVVCGAAVGDAVLKNHSLQGKPTMIRLDVVLGLLVTAFGSWNAWSAVPVSQGVEAGNAGRWQEAASAFSLAVTRDPYLSVTNQQRALAYSALALEGEPGAISEAVHSMESAVALDPDWGLNHANLGVLYRAAGDLEKAQSSLRAAVKAAPHAWLYYLNLGILEEEIGNKIEAENAYLHAAENMPAEFVFSYFWRSTDIRRKAVPNEKAENVLPQGDQLPQLETAAKGTALMRPFLKLADAYLNLDRLDEAGRILTLAELAVPGENDPLEYHWLKARLAAQQGNLFLAVKEGQAALDGYRVQGIFGPGTYGSLLYAPLMFRRPEMAMEVVPQFNWIPLPDVWAMRAQQLAGWLSIVGEDDLASALMLEINRKVPDL